MISGLHYVAHPEAHWSDSQLEFNEVSPMNTAPMLQGTSAGSCEEAKRIDRTENFAPQLQQDEIT